jgi:hypothetical protein
VDWEEEEEEEEEEDAASDAASDVDRDRVPGCRLVRSEARTRRRADGDGDDAEVRPPRPRALSDDGDAAEDAEDIASDIAREGVVSARGTGVRLDRRGRDFFQQRLDADSSAFLSVASVLRFSSIQAVCC